MSKRDRTILFFTCLALFLLVAPSTVFYSQGYRLDLENRRLVKTGGLFFKVVPKEVEIYLNNKSIKKTDFFFGSTLVENLLPQSYQVKVKKKGYQDWKKMLAVQASRVTEAKNIVLIPRDLAFEPIGQNVRDFIFSEDGTKVIIVEVFPSQSAEVARVEQTEKTETKSWALKLYDWTTGVKSHLVAEDEIAKKVGSATAKIELLQFQWSPDGKRVLLKTEVKNGNSEERARRYFLVELEQSPPKILALGFLNDQTQKISFNPRDSRQLFFLKKELSVETPDKARNQVLGVQPPSSEPLNMDLFEASIDEKSLRSVLKEVVDYQIWGQQIIWLSQAGFLEKADFTGASRRLLLEPLEGEAGQIHLLNSQIFLQRKGEVFQFQDSRTLEKIATNVAGFKPAADQKKIVFWNETEVWLYYLAQEQGQPQKEKGEKVFLARFSGPIKQVFWWTGHYLLFDVAGEIKIVEVDDRDEIQIWTLADFKAPEIFFNSRDRKLSVLNEGTFYSSKKMF